MPQLQQMHFSREQYQPLIISDPRIKTAQARFILFLIWLGIFVLVTDIKAFEELITYGRIVPFWPYVIGILSSVFGACWNYGAIKYLKWFEIQRLAAAQGAQYLLSDQQPGANPEALPVPSTMNIKLTMAMGENLLVTNGLVMWFFYALMSQIMEMLSKDSLMPWYAAASIVILVGADCLGTFGIAKRTRQTLKVTSEGITSGPDTGSAPTLMRWHEACLFACYPLPLTLTGRPTMVYELSSDKHIVRWNIQSGVSSSLAGLNFRIQEQNMQMQALCSMVAAKTGLPLYDLGKASHTPYGPTNSSQFSIQ